MKKLILYCVIFTLNNLLFNISYADSEKKYPDLFLNTHKIYQNLLLSEPISPWFQKELKKN
jgi:hypothetical protein